MNIKQYREGAYMAYERVPRSEGAAWLQAAMLAEIALQLQKQNEHLEEIGKQLALVTVALDELRIKQ